MAVIPWSRRLRNNKSGYLAWACLRRISCYRSNRFSPHAIRCVLECGARGPKSKQVTRRSGERSLGFHEEPSIAIKQRVNCQTSKSVLTISVNDHHVVSIHEVLVRFVFRVWLVGSIGFGWLGGRIVPAFVD